MSNRFLGYSFCASFVSSSLVGVCLGKVVRRSLLGNQVPGARASDFVTTGTRY